MERVRGTLCAWFLYLIATGLCASEAVADEWYSYFQATCAPELNYFHFQSIALDNADPKVLNHSDKLAQQGIHALSDLDNAGGHQCVLGDTVISFGGVRRSHNPIEDEASFWLAVNGKVVYETNDLFFEGDGLRKSTAITADTLQVEICRAGTNPRGGFNERRATNQSCTTVHLMPLPL